MAAIYQTLRNLVAMSFNSTKLRKCEVCAHQNRVFPIGIHKIFEVDVAPIISRIEGFVHLLYAALIAKPNHVHSYSGIHHLTKMPSYM